MHMPSASRSEFFIATRLGSLCNERRASRITGFLNIDEDVFQNDDAWSGTAQITALFSLGPTQAQRVQWEEPFRAPPSRPSRERPEVAGVPSRVPPSRIPKELSSNLPPPPKKTEKMCIPKYRDDEFGKTAKSGSTLIR